MIDKMNEIELKEIQQLIKQKPIKKAWTVYHEGMIQNWKYPSAPFISVDDIPSNSFAEKKGQAKQSVKSYPYPSEYLLEDDKEHSYTDLRAVRARYADVIIFEDKEIRRNRAVEILTSRFEQKQAVRAVNRFPDTAEFYVQSGYVGNAVLWWHESNSGYTCDINQAKRFDKSEIIAMFESKDFRQKYTAWESEGVCKAIRQIVDGQYLPSESNVFR